MKKIRGIITIPVTLAISVGMIVVGGVTVFWRVAGSTERQINEVKTEVSAELSLTNQRVSSVEKGFEMMLENQKTMMSDIKSLIQK